MSYRAFQTTDPEEEKGVTWGDYGKAAAGTAAGIGAGSAGLMRQMFEAGQDPAAAQIFRGLQTASRNVGEDIEGSMTEEGRARNAAGVTSEKFWEHPVSSIALKAVGMSPYLLAAAIPGALVGEGVAAMAATGGAAGWLAAGDVVDEITKKPDKMSDADLRAQSKLYDGFRADGMEEKDARQQLNQIMVGAKPALAFMLGAGTGVLGPAGNVVRRLGQGAVEEAKIAAGKTAASKGTDFLGQHGIKAAAAEGAATEFAEEGYGGYAAQKADIQAGLRDKYDANEIFDRALTGAVLGAGFGGVSGIGGGKGKAKADEIRETQERGRGEEVAAPQVPAGTAGVATEAEAPPATRRQTAASKKGIEVVEAGQPNQAETAAITDLAQPTQPKVSPEAAVPPTPEPPVPPNQLAPQAAQPPQAPTPPQGPAVGVTPEVTATPATPQTDQQLAAGPSATPGSTGRELGASTPSTAGVGEVATAPAPVPPGTTPMPSAPAQVATAPQSTQQAQELPGQVGPTPAIAEEVAKAPSESVSPTGRVLQDISKEGKGKQKAQAIAQAAREKAATAEPVEKVVGKKKLPLAHKMSQEERAAHASRIFGEETTEKLEIPDTPEKRKAMALKLKPVVDRIVGGIELRENLPQNILDHYNKSAKDNPLTPEEHTRYHKSLPKRVGDKNMSPHVSYLREAIDVQKMLEKGKDLGPKSDNYRRVLNFVAAHNEKSPDLIGMSRKETGDAIATSRRGGTAEQGESTQAKIEAGGETKGAVKSAVSEGAAAPGKVLEGEAKAKAAAEVLAKIKAKAAAVEPAKAEPAVPAPKKEMPKKVAEKVAITKPETKITEEAKPEPKPEPKEEPVATEQQKEAQQEVTPEVTEKPADVGEVRTTAEVAKLSPHERILQAKADKAEAEALAAREKASAERKAKAKPRATPEQIKAALEKMKAKKAEDVLGPQLMAEGTPARKTRTLQLEADEHDIWETPAHKARDIYGHESSSLSEGRPASEVLSGLDLEHLPELPKYLQGFTRRRLAEIMGDIKVYIASPELARDTAGVPSGGFYHPGGGARGSDYIVINADSMKSRQRFAHVVIHESLHAALFNRIEADPKLRERIKTLMAHMKSELDADMSMKGTGNWAAAKYSLTNVHEFISEALSNPRLQEIMANIAVSPEMVQKLNLDTQKPWTLWGAFTEKVRAMLGFPKGTFNLLHETLKTISPALEVERSRAAARKTAAEPQMLSMDALRDAAVGQLGTTSTNWRGKLALAKDKISSLYMMARRGQQYFGSSNPLNRLFETRAKMEAAKDDVLKDYGGLTAADKIARAERTHPEQMARIKQIALDASLHDINLDGSNDHLGKDKLMGVQAKNEIAQLQKAWNDKSLDPVRDTVRAAMKFFKDIHNAVSRETINNILAEGNIHDKALAERIHNNGLTEEDRKTWADTKLVSALDQVSALKRRQGSFVPFRRYGDYISAAEHELKVPANATKINDNTLQFVDPTGKGGDARARAQVKTYLRGNDHTPQGNKLTPSQIRKVWVDKNNPTEIVEGTDPNAIPAYRVAMQTQHVEMHETEAAAKNSQKDLADAGLVNSRTHKREEAYRTEATNIQSAMGTVLRSLEKQQRYIDADSTQKAAMREMFHDLTLGLSGTTSIKNSMRQRRNVAGQSRDLGRVTADYARMTANHLAKLQYRPQIDAIFKEMRDHMKANQYDNDAIRRDEVYKEFVDRIYGRSAAQAEQHKPGAVTRLLQMSRLSRLAGPSFHIINAHEPWTTSAAVIGGRHGFGTTLRQLTESYNFIGGRGAVMSGLRDTVSAYTSDIGFTDYVKLFKDTIGKSKSAGPDKIGRMQDMIDYMNARNLYSNAAIFEVGKYANPEGNIAGRALDRADLMANQVGSAIEAINRTVTGLTAYNLEYKKNGGNHEAAMHYAYSTAHETMGDYSHWNAAPVFNTGAGRFALQFKKFGHKTYYLLGNVMGGVLKGDPQAMKQFAGLMVTHGLVAGALGMPTEPFKVALLAANALGVTGFTPDDYEYAVRQLAARIAGQKGGEIISKGLYRGLGIEVSGRLGLDSPLTFGAPKSQKDADIKSFLFDTMAGAPAGYLMDQVKAAQAAFKGDFATAIEKASPLRTVGDITKAAVGLAGDKKGPTGKITQEQFTPWEAGVRALGFTPSSAAEMGALRGTQARESKRLSANRSEIVNAWVDATGADKVKVQRTVQEFNAGRPKDEQISQKDLTNAVARRKREEKVTEHGITTSKRTRAIDELAKSVFNP